MKHRIVRPVAFACATMLGLAVGGLAMAQKTAAVAKPSKAQLAAELAATLQACSYDGSPLAFSPPDLSKGGGTGKRRRRCDRSPGQRPLYRTSGYRTAGDASPQLA